MDRMHGDETGVFAQVTVSLLSYTQGIQERKKKMRM
jgi:hypothetical protein